MKLIIIIIFQFVLFSSCSEIKKGNLGYILLLDDIEVSNKPFKNSTKFTCPKDTISEVFNEGARKYLDEEGYQIGSEIVCQNKVGFILGSEGYDHNFNRSYLESNKEEMKLLYEFSKLFTPDIKWYSYNGGEYTFSLSYVPNYDKLCYGWSFESLFLTYQCSKVIKKGINSYTLDNELIQLDLLKKENGINLKIRKKIPEAIDQYGTTEIFKKLDGHFWEKILVPKYDPDKYQECRKQETREGYEKCIKNALIVLPVKK